MEELADLLEFFAFAELMVVVQPEFNRGPFSDISAPQTSANIKKEYFQIIELRRRSRMLTCLLDKCYSVKSTLGGNSVSLRECFIEILTGTIAELSTLLVSFKRKDMTVDHYSESRMQRGFMLANLNRVIQHRGISHTSRLNGVWGSSHYRGGTFTVVMTGAMCPPGNKHCTSFPCI
jgi:hypothetical protein